MSPKKKDTGKKERKKSKSTNREGSESSKKRTDLTVILFIVLASVVVLLALAGPIYVLYYKRNHAEVCKSQTKQLISVIVLFRHGARAPVDLPLHTTAAAEFSELFPNGAGQLTEIGLENSTKLGEFLGQRYVQTGFLRSPPLPSQFYFRSRSIDRCLMSGALTASGMWADPNNPEFIPVPIYGQEKNDRLLTHLQNCELEAKRLSDKCGKAPPSPKDWSIYEGFVFECIGLDKETELFKNATHYAQVDGLIQQDRNGMVMPKWFGENRKEIYDLYQKTFSFIVGVNDYHDKEILQLKQGLIMKTILDTLRKRWDEWVTSKTIAKRKFIAYSTQDWMLLAYLDALGCSKAALGGTVPGYNSIVVLELAEHNGQPFVEVFFKDNSMNELKDITEAVRGCGSSPCALEKFLNCCDDYMTEDPKTVCGKQS